MSKSAPHWVAGGLLAAMLVFAGGVALKESATVDEFAHVGAGLSYWQRFDFRLNGEHPPLGKLLAGLPLAIRGTRADYSSPSWITSRDFFFAYGAQYAFGDAVLGRWNDWRSTIMWARFPMLILTLALGWIVYRYASRIGGSAGGLLCLAVFVTTPAFLVFGPLVITDVPVTLFSLVALWRLGEVWESPTRRNARLFGMAFAGALLAKFTGVLIFAAVLALFLQTRFWPSAGEPADQLSRRKWRGERWRAVWRGSGCAAGIVYAVYFVFSWNQPLNALSALGNWPGVSLIQRLLMPPWLYLRGFLMMAATGARPTYLLGHNYSHGVPFYFPVVFALKSTLGFLALLVIAATAGILRRKSGKRAIPEPVRPQWRALMTGFFVYLTICLLSLLNLGIRHFMMPVVLMTLMLAPLPRMIRALPGRRIWQGAVAFAAASSFVAIAMSFPYLMPFANSLSLGHPLYQLLNDSNVSWNDGLPAVEQFARDHRLNEIALDWASISDPAPVVPQERDWDCQQPTDRDAGQWVAVAAVSIRENHNCAYLEQYPHEALAGGSFYVFRMPVTIPAAGTPGGPPLSSERRILWGMPIDMRSFAVMIERHPEHFESDMRAMGEKMTQMFRQKR